MDRQDTDYRGPDQPQPAGAVGKDSGVTLPLPGTGSVSDLSVPPSSSETGRESSEFSEGTSVRVPYSEGSHSGEKRTEYRLFRPMPSQRSAGDVTQPQVDTDSLLSVLFPPRHIPTNERPSVEGVKLGHFELLDRIGQGGMGSVFLARDSRLDRTIALKVLSPAHLSDPAALLRFENEA